VRRKLKMLKKAIMLLFSALILLLTSCVPYRYPTPWGDWASDDPFMTLHIWETPNPEIGLHYSGFTVINDEIIAIQFRFSTATGDFSIHDAEMVLRHVTLDVSTLFSGNFYTSDDVLYLNIAQDYIHVLGVERVALHRIPYRYPALWGDWASDDPYMTLHLWETSSSETGRPNSGFTIVNDETIAIQFAFNFTTGVFSILDTRMILPGSYRWNNTIFRGNFYMLDDVLYLNIAQDYIHVLGEIGGASYRERVSTVV
jgi:hypothetical protein